MTEQRRVPDAVAGGEGIDFLRAGLNSAERLWPRFQLAYRSVREVPIVELRTHPDLVERVASLAPADAWMLMGAPVLVAPKGLIYALALGTHTFVVHAGDGAAGEDGSIAETPQPPSMGGGRFRLSKDWVCVNPWAGNTGKIAELERLVRIAREFTDRTAH